MECDVGSGTFWNRSIGMGLKVEMDADILMVVYGD